MMCSREDSGACDEVRFRYVARAEVELAIARQWIAIHKDITQSRTFIRTERASYKVRDLVTQTRC